MRPVSPFGDAVRTVSPDRVVSFGGSGGSGGSGSGPGPGLGLFSALFGGEASAAGAYTRPLSAQLEPCLTTKTPSNILNPP